MSKKEEEAAKKNMKLVIILAKLLFLNVFKNVEIK